VESKPITGSLSNFINKAHIFQTAAQDNKETVKLHGCPTAIEWNSSLDFSQHPHQ
jgi:hypothetical protein